MSNKMVQKYPHIDVLLQTKYMKGSFKMSYSTGEKPGKGQYQCTNCGQTVYLDDSTDTLPPCPKCDKTTYIKKS